MPRSPRRVAFVFGTRPEAIKVAPVIRRLSASSWARPVVIVTGQHQRILDQVLDLFAIVPDHDLQIHEPGQTLTGVTVRVLEGLQAVFVEDRPDVVVVQGDTTTSFAAALAAFYARIPVAHLEAGLRTGDLSSPFPEEMNRQATARLCDLHLAPTPVSRDNLLAEAVRPGDVVVTGNTVIDALRSAVDQQVAFTDPALERLQREDRPVLLVTAHRRESWGEGIAAVAAAVSDLALRHPDLLTVLPLHPNPQIRDTVRPLLSGLENVLLVEPLGYGEFARLMARATVVLTDSGGVQEEAPSLGKPVLVTRDTTERPEAVAAGTARLVGTDHARIVAEVSALLRDAAAYGAMATTVNPYGDGRAAVRVEAALKRLLGLPARVDEFRPVLTPAPDEVAA
jgi:UDP-N-acetylglucosamine 2-epimerase (non-hydrolysing)